MGKNKFLLPLLLAGLVVLSSGGYLLYTAPNISTNSSNQPHNQSHPSQTATAQNIFTLVSTFIKTNWKIVTIIAIVILLVILLAIYLNTNTAAKEVTKDNVESHEEMVEGGVGGLVFFFMTVLAVVCGLLLILYYKMTHPITGPEQAYKKYAANIPVDFVYHPESPAPESTAQVPNLFTHFEPEEMLHTPSQIRLHRMLLLVLWSQIVAAHPNFKTLSTDHQTLVSSLTEFKFTDDNKFTLSKFETVSDEWLYGLGDALAEVMRAAGISVAQYPSMVSRCRDEIMEVSESGLLENLHLLTLPSA